jgi:hypothetical protein
MATLIANQVLNMSSSSGLGIFDTDGGLDPLVHASYADGRQVVSVPGGYLDITANVSDSENASGATFSGGISRLELQTGSSLDAPAMWTLTGVPVSVSGSVSISGDNINMSIGISGIGTITASMDIGTLEVLDFTDNFSGTSYNSFVEFLMRQGDNITGSASSDTLAGFGGNDTINGKGGADKINGGAGSDTIIWGDGDVVNGGGGKDILKVGAALLDLTTLADNKIVNVETIKLAGTTTLTLNLQDLLAFPGDDLRVTGDGSDTVNFDGTLDTGTTEGTFTRYSLGGGASLLIDSDINVI